MNAFDYLSVLISIILALGMTRVLGGAGEMLQARSRPPVRIYPGLALQYRRSPAIDFASRGASETGTLTDNYLSLARISSISFRRKARRV